MSAEQAPVLALMGPTASGKSALSLALARHLPLEIVSVDSVLVYRGLDIGSAKPTWSERQAVVHHLIDCCDPAEPYSVADFCSQAHPLVEQIASRGHLPLLVGGTPLYFKAFFEGLSPLPRAHKALRETLQAQPLEVLYAQLQQRDPVRAAALHPHDGQRIVRALEILTVTGRPITYDPPLRRPAYRPSLFSLCPCDKEVLASRFESMLEAGFEQEVQQLMQSPGFCRELPAFRAVGYREMVAYLSGEVALVDLRRLVVSSTMQLAKRQMTWLRAWPHLQWLSPEEALPCLLRAGEAALRGLG